MKIIRNAATVKSSLVRISLLTVAAALLLTGVLLVSEEVRSNRKATIESLTVQGKILGSNSVSSLLFNDRQAAEETLAAVRNDPRIEYAALLTPDGTIFAEFSRTAASANKDENVSGCEEGVTTSWRYVSLCQAIVFGKDSPGTIYLRSDLSAFYRHIARHGVIVLGVIVLAAGLAYLLISRMQNIITSPVRMLVTITDAVSKTKDYSLRSSIRHPEEFATLSEGFNVMLEQIQQRDDELEIYRKHLEEQISLRTSQVESTNAVLQKELAERLAVENALRQSEEQFRGIASAAQDAIVRVSDSMRISYWNHAAERIFGYSESEALGMDLLALVPERYHEELSALWASYQGSKSDFLAGKTFEAFARIKGGNEIPVEVSISFLPVDDRLHIIGIARDTTERKIAEETIKKMAFYDNLTGQPNRQLFRDRVEMAILRARREKRHLAVMFIDLDRFKNINDSLGHSVGDIMLKTSAERISSVIRKADTVSRHGGDEFTLLVSNVDEIEDIAKLAQKILDTLSGQMVIEGHELFVTASIGISIYPYDGATFEDLTKNADMAMYNAKEQGRNNFKFYTEDMNRRVIERIDMERGLRRAVERGELVLHYQPRVDIMEMTIVGMEALLRWSMPESGLISPSEFIRLAEEGGLIRQIGSWVLRQACLESRRLSDLGIGPLKVSVNVSARQFYQDDFAEQVDEALHRAGLDPQWLEIEITETALMQDIPRGAAMLRMLHDQGVHFSIDDFGIGHSSLSYLKGLPVHTLKIDQSFIANAVKSEADRAIIDTIIALASNLKLHTVAEGVETREQLHFLQKRRCPEAQGFLFAPALPFDEFVKFVKEGALSRNPFLHSQESASQDTGNPAAS